MSNPVQPYLNVQTLHFGYWDLWRLDPAIHLPWADSFIPDQIPTDAAFMGLSAASPARVRVGWKLESYKSLGDQAPRLDYCDLTELEIEVPLVSLAATAGQGLLSVVSNNLADADGTLGRPGNIVATPTPLLLICRNRNPRAAGRKMTLVVMYAGVAQEFAFDADPNAPAQVGVRWSARQPRNPDPETDWSDIGIGKIRFL